MYIISKFVHTPALKAIRISDMGAARYLALRTGPGMMVGYKISLSLGLHTSLVALKKLVENLANKIGFLTNSL